MLTYLTRSSFMKLCSFFIYIFAVLWKTIVIFMPHIRHFHSLNDPPVQSDVYNIHQYMAIDGDAYRWSRAQTIQVWTGIFFRTMIKTIKYIGHKTSISVGRLDAAQNVYLSRPETCCFRTWTDCATNLKGQWSWMVWADDDFSYFDWWNRLAKFRHGVLPDHVSFRGKKFGENSELDGLCPRPSICQ